MQFGVGCDVEEIRRFERLVEKTEFVRLVYLPEEEKYCREKTICTQHFAAIFCGKEAIIKALGCLRINNIGFLDIEIFHAPNGCPQAKLLKKVGFDLDIKISLSHSKTTAMAQVIVLIN